MYTFNSQVDPIQLGKKYFKTQFEQSSHLEVCLLFSQHVNIGAFWANLRQGFCPLWGYPLVHHPTQLICIWIFVGPR